MRSNLFDGFGCILAAISDRLESLAGRINDGLLRWLLAEHRAACSPEIELRCAESAIAGFNP
jgi:hypothetical protein